MVDDGGQLYTIEGVAAALIMVMTAYLVINATSVYTAGDTHINDMHLETLGTDALTVMGSPMNSNEAAEGNSTLRSILEDSYTVGARNDTFKSHFLNLTNSSGILTKKDIQFIANYTCTAANSGVSQSFSFSNSTRPFTGTEHTVRVTKWVIVDKTCGAESSRVRAALVEVILWFD